MGGLQATGKPYQYRWPVGEAVCHCLSLRGERVAHVQRPEDVLLDVGLVGLFGDGLHDHAQRPVVGVAVLPGRADRLGEGRGPQRADSVSQRGVLGSTARRESIAGRLRQPTDLVQELANGHPRGGIRVVDPPPRQVSLDWGVQVNWPASLSCMTAMRGERLGHRTDEERRLGSHLSSRFRLTEALEMHGLAAVDDAQGQPGDALRRHLRLDVAIDGGEIRAVVRGGGRSEHRRGDAARHCHQETDGKSRKSFIAIRLLCWTTTSGEADCRASWPWWWRAARAPVRCSGTKVSPIQPMHDFQMGEDAIEDLPMVDRPSGRLLPSQRPTRPGPIVVAAPWGGRPHFLVD